MAMTWTEEQQKVISLRDRNILVSAAAGSGKTAVLVQRILSKITDASNPVDIDRLLIMTFTRAAAGEMKERISKALEQALFADPDNEHLQRQMTLIHTAQITTIDGFCSYIIRNYFHLIGLDPGYRTGDEGELKLLQNEVLDQLLEDSYAEKKKEYERFVECYAWGKSDDEVRELILNLYQAAMSNPFPEEWLDGCLDSYRGEKPAWWELLWQNAREDLQEAMALACEAKKLCYAPGGPYLYGDAIDSDLLFLEEVSRSFQEEDYDRAAALLAKPSFTPLSRKRAADVEEDLKERFKALRDEEKSVLKDLSARYFQSSREEIAESLACCLGPMETLVELTKEFIQRYGEEKREKNLLDFTDMEHFALQILMKKENGEISMSQAARELSQKYDEVMVDEYQDSNYVQELITKCVSGWVQNRNNIFMVGDVKQSIYRFRLARPELFMEKYKTYTTEEGPMQRIDLHKNFRSRSEVLDSVNELFRQIMGEDLGGIAYDDAAALYPGAAFPEQADRGLTGTEVLLIEKDSEELKEEPGTYTAQELEALAIAFRIRSMVGKVQVWDQQAGEYRGAQYGDMVILLRTAYGWAEVFQEVLTSQGIPSYTASKTGYFSALEVVTVLNYLRICDNPLQDIPMAGVLRSPIAGCTAQELAMLRAEHPKGLLYQCVCDFAEDGQMDLFAGESPEGRLREKLRGFLDTLWEIRRMASYTPVHQLILAVLEKTGYGSLAGALPGGAQRSANLAMLVEKAMDYEKTSYRGLFHFTRYIEQLQKYEVDYGEVNLSGAAGSAVQIMTIHKSKGLEFPIVFAAGMGKQFNFQDMNARLLIHPELGLGADAVLPEKRILSPTLVKQVIRRQLLKESLGEELRVLYVALTRAREKLILTGTVGNLEKLLLSLERFKEYKGQLLPLGSRLKAKNYWGYVLPVLAGSGYLDGLLEGKHTSGGTFQVVRITPLDLTYQETAVQTDWQMQKLHLENWDVDRVYDKSLRQEIKERFEYVYPYGYLSEIPAKVSVSDLKKRSFHGMYEKEENLLFEPDIIPLVPKFIAETEEAFTGAARGTAYHKVMECLDYTRIQNDGALLAQIQELHDQKKMSGAEAECIQVARIRRFLDTPLGRRMGQAALAGNLFREQPFVMSVPARMLNEEWPGEETVLVQGIIDAYFAEGEELILVDYKTDRVSAGEEQKLVELYHVQLEDYAAALERLTGKKVRETYIYSFTLGKEIMLKGDGER